MKQLSNAFRQHLDSGATTLCWCWRVIRNDGLVLGFTDHDNDLNFDDTLFTAATGFVASELNESLGLNIDNMDVSGVLNSDSLQEQDLIEGLYDNAAVEIFRVNWSDVTQRLLMKTGSIGEVRRGEKGFTAEIRSLAHHLQQPKGRVYQYGCDANLGDVRCSVDLEDSAYKGIGTVLSVVSARSFRVSGLDGYDAGWFTEGLLTWTSGGMVGKTAEVKFHSAFEDVVTVELWREPRMSFDVDDDFEIAAGCDKQFGTCRQKFGNALNFRGFPKMPGNDFILSYPNRDDGSNDGGRLGA